MSNVDFQNMLKDLTESFQSGNQQRYERLLDYLALECTDTQWQVVDDTCKALESPATDVGA